MSNNRHTYRNLSPTPLFGEGYNLWSALRAQTKRPKDLVPLTDVPVVRTDLKQYRPARPSVIWFGHSSYLIYAGGLTFLVDPVFSGHASPVSFMVKAFPGADLYKPADMPEIDYLIISHNHYDHLDLKTVRALAPKIRNVIAPQGVKKDLAGIPLLSGPVRELDWWETAPLGEDVCITSTPARHFSGRGLRRNGSLWSSYVLEVAGCRLFLGGDSGYDSHFSEIGAKYGPFDLAILECGQYDVIWPYIHSMPEELITEGRELQAKAIMPVHWAKFALANHSWKEPVKRFVQAARAAGSSYTTPRIGEPVVLGEALPKTVWWE